MRETQNQFNNPKLVSDKIMPDEYIIHEIILKKIKHNPRDMITQRF